MFYFYVDLVYTCFMPHTVSTCPMICVTTCLNVLFFGYTHVHAATMHISMHLCMHRLYNVVRYYI